jgi:hypothetical protein
MPNRHRMLALLFSLTAASAAAQSTPPIERLSFFEGTWAMEGAPADGDYADDRSNPLRRGIVDGRH